MRLKPIPEPPSTLAAIDEVRRSVPLVPGRVDDCCARLRDRHDLPDRQAANDWLAFLRALGLVEETPRGFKRTAVDPTPTRLRKGIRERVLFAPEAIALLRDASADDPVTPGDLFAATRNSVPRHDRARDSNWETTWLERADRLLRWLVLVDLAVRIDGGEHPAGSEHGTGGTHAEGVEGDVDRRTRSEAASLKATNLKAANLETANLEAGYVAGDAA